MKFLQRITKEQALQILQEGNARFVETETGNIGKRVGIIFSYRER